MKNKINERLSRFVPQIKIKDMFSEFDNETLINSDNLSKISSHQLVFAVENFCVKRYLNIKHGTIKTNKSNEWNNEGQRSYNLTRMFIDSLNIVFKSTFVQYS